MDSVKLGLVMSAHKTPKKPSKDKPSDKVKESRKPSSQSSYGNHPPTENFVGELETD